MRVYLVRHPKPEVGPDICYGRTDLAVSPQEQARSVLALASVLPESATLFSSPLLRCSTLATSLARSLSCSALILDARLSEMHFGAWEMRAWSDIPRSEVDDWTSDLTGYRPGGGENVIEVAQRVHAFHQDLLRLRRDCAIVICHAGTIRLLLACRQALPLEEMALRAAQTGHKIAYGEVVILDC